LQGPRRLDRIADEETDAEPLGLIGIHASATDRYRNGSGKRTDRSRVSSK
jgi:hypothetical protein